MVLLLAAGIDTRLEPSGGSSGEFPDASWHVASKNGLVRSRLNFSTDACKHTRDSRRSEGPAEFLSEFSGSESYPELSVMFFMTIDVEVAEATQARSDVAAASLGSTRQPGPLDPRRPLVMYEFLEGLVRLSVIRQSNPKMPEKELPAGPTPSPVARSMHIHK